MGTLLIKVKHAPSVALPVVNQAVDQHFALAAESSLLLTVQDDAQYESILQYLEQAIVKTPKNLRLHIQRIFLLLEQRASLPLSAALIDFFIITGSAGSHLKLQLLKLASPLLSENCRQFLSQHCRGELTAVTPLSDSLAVAPYCLLSQGFIGQPILVSSTQACAQDAAQLSLHQQALACMEYGQLEEALALLLQARAENPANDEVSVDLLSIYLSLGMKAEQEALLAELQVDIE